MEHNKNPNAGRWIGREGTGEGHILVGGQCIWGRIFHELYHRGLVQLNTRALGRSVLRSGIVCDLIAGTKHIRADSRVLMNPELRRIIFLGIAHTKKTRHRTDGSKNGEKMEIRV